MSMYEQYIMQYNIRWQQRMVKTNYIVATVVLIFEIAYYFILTYVGLRHQSSVEYISRFILLPAFVIYSFCTICWAVVYRSKRSSEIKSITTMFTMVALCGTVASIHNIFPTTLCSFFVPLAISVVFGNSRITNIVGCFCVTGIFVSLFFASVGLRGNDPYFLLDCLMLFIVFGISWFATLLLLKNEQEKRHEIERTVQLENEITVRKQEQEELRLRLEQYQIIMNQTTDILFEWDIRKDILKFSANWKKKFGYEPITSDISSQIPLSENVHPDDMGNFVKLMNEIAGGKPYSEAEFRIKDNNNKYRWCRIRATAQFDDKGNVIKAVGVILDIDDERNEKKILLKKAQRDALGNIYNKATISDIVARRMENADISVRQALLIVDIDYFKTVNDTYGHMAGDNVISDVAITLKSMIQGKDVVGRIGGDEFLFYITEVESEDDALCRAEKIHKALGMIRPIPDADHITCSIGMAIFPDDAKEYSELFRYADSALYCRKNQKRNGVTMYGREAKN